MYDSQVHDRKRLCVRGRISAGEKCLTNLKWVQARKETWNVWERQDCEALWAID